MYILYTYIFHVILFPPLPRKAEILVVLVKKVFLQKNADVKCLSMWSGNVAVWSGNVAVAKSYNYLELFGSSQRKTFRKKKVVLSETYFSSKRQKFSTILKMQVYIYLFILYIYITNIVYIYIYIFNSLRQACRP